MQKRKGHIITNGIKIEPHEHDIANVFTWLGSDVEFIPPSYTKGQKMADAMINGVTWEFKSPQGNSRKTLEHIIKRAARQSSNIIIDLRRLDRKDDWCLSELKRLAKCHKSIKKLRVITKGKIIVDILR